MAETLVEMTTRLCKPRYSCVGCHLESFGVDGCLGYLISHADKSTEQIEIIRKWAAENPPKTWEQELHRLMPWLTDETTYCVGHYFPWAKVDGSCPNMSCKECWNRPYVSLEDSNKD